MKVDIWRFTDSNFKICVDLDKKTKNEIRARIEHNISGIAKKLNVNPTRLYEYFIYQKSTIPLRILQDLIILLGISKSVIQRKIVLYKQQQVPKRNSIKKPKLPIEINPYLTSVVANLFFDGSVPRDGKGTYYNQKNELLMKDFIERVKFVFGDVFNTTRLDHRGVLKCRIPRIIGEICKEIYNIRSFGTFDAEMPDLIFKLDEDHKRAFILTAIIDEGSIAYDGSITFGISNKKMIENFDRLCKDVGLKTNGVKQNRNSNHFYVYITSINKFRDILTDMKSKYPLISLRYKEDRLIKALEIKDQKFFYTEEFSDKRKELVIQRLNKKGHTINQLSQILLIPPRTLRRYMYRLMKENKVKREKVGNQFLYNLKT